MKLVATAILIGSAFSSAASASTAVVSFTNEQVFFGQNQSLGYEFVANSNLSVTALGFYDSGSDGLVAAHDVGIFTTDGTLLASITVGPGGTLLNNFSYANLGTALNLTAGTSYRIAGTTAGSQDGWVFQAQNIVTDGITYTASYFAQGTPVNLTFPETVASGREYITVNFLHDNGAIPEPATWAMMIGGFALMGASMRRTAARLATA